MPRPGGRMVPVSVVARETGMCVRTIKRWIRRKTLRGVKLSGRWYVNRAAWEALRATLDEANVAPDAAEKMG